MIFGGAFILPMGIICCLCIANRVATDYQKCTTAPNLADDYSSFNQFASAAVPGSAVFAYAAQPYSFGHGWSYGHTTLGIVDSLLAETTAITAAAASIAAFNDQQISTLNVSGPAGTGPGATGPAAGSNSGGREGRLSGSSVSSLQLGREGSTRSRQRLVRQDAFECPPEYSHTFDGSSGFHSDHPPSYELALLCPTRKSMDEPSNEAGGSSGAENANTATTSASATVSQGATDSAANRPSSSTDAQAPPPPYDPKTMGLRWFVSPKVIKKLNTVWWFIAFTWLVQDSSASDIYKSKSDFFTKVSSVNFDLPSSSLIHLMQNFLLPMTLQIPNLLKSSFKFIIIAISTLIFHHFINLLLFFMVPHGPTWS